MKRTLDDLAIFGGRPAFAEPLHVGRPNIGDRKRLVERIHDILDRRWLTNDGPYVKRFEQRVAEVVGVQHCVAVSSATIGLEIAIRALGLSGEVIVPAMTFVATAHALRWQGLTPVFGDIDPHTLCLDPRQLENRITPRTSGIIGVHLFGQTCDCSALAEIAARHELQLMYDAAHAFGCSRQGQMVGTFGRAEVFSFHATKFVNSFEGGAVVTNDPQLAERLRLMRNFGFADMDQVIHLGTNGKMPEASAAMGLTSLESMAQIIAVNRRNYAAYVEGLSDVPALALSRYNEQERNNYHYIVLLIDSQACGVTRDQLVEVLWAEQVLARRYYYPGCHRMEPYRSSQPHAGQALPVTEQLAERILCLPTGTAIGVEDVQTICQIIALVISRADQVRARLHRQPASRPQRIGS